MRIKKMFALGLVILMITSFSACSSFLTAQSPLYSRLENGKISTGRLVKYKYSGALHGNVGYLEKTPMCAEVIEKDRVAEKRIRGRVLSWFEMALFGLGLYDRAKAYAIVEASKKVEPLAEFESSNLLVCGKKEPAADEEIVLFVRPEVINDVVPKSYYRTARTDENGMIDFNKVFADEHRTLNLTARLATNDSEAVSFLYIPKNSR